MSSGANVGEIIGEVDRLLAQAGFVELKSPLVVGGVPFDVVRAYEAGPGFLDLVVVVDAIEGTPSRLRQSYWLVERIARALDQARSRRPLTAVVLHDAAAARVPTEDFLRLGRVLLVSDADNVKIELAPILPIVLESNSEVARDPLDMLSEQVSSDRDADVERALIEAARVGPNNVQTLFIDWINDSFGNPGAAG